MPNCFSRLDVFLALTLLMSTQALGLPYMEAWALTSLALGLTVMRWQFFYKVDTFRFARLTLGLILRGGLSGALIGIAGQFWNEKLSILHLTAGAIMILAIGLFLSSAYTLSRTANAYWRVPQVQGAA